MRKVILVLMLMLLPAMAWGADIAPTRISGGYMWDLVDTAITATATTSNMVGSTNCDTFTLLISTSDTTSMTAAINVGRNSSNMDAVVTYTLAADATSGYQWSFPTPMLNITFTITTGQVDDVVIFCYE